LKTTQDDILKRTAKAVVKVYLFKGVHHYINCYDPELVNLSEDILCNYNIPHMCVNIQLKYTCGSFIN